MSLQVNYDDDFFYLATLIKTLNWALNLELDPQYFATRVHEDIEFLDKTLDKLRLSLVDHGMVHGKMNYLRTLLRTERLFVECLTGIPQSESELLKSLNSHKKRYDEILERHRRSLVIIQESLDKFREEQPEEETISEAEYRVLLEPKPEESE